jgi:hypothetical protein
LDTSVLAAFLATPKHRAVESPARLGYGRSVNGPLHLPSLAVGFVGALVVFLGLTIVWKTGKLVIKLALLAAIIMLVGGAYASLLKG